VDDKYSFTVINWAYLNGDIDLKDSAQVDVVCQYPQRASIEVSNVVITTSPITAATMTVSGTFYIKNASGGDITIVGLGDVKAYLTGKAKGKFVEVGGVGATNASGAVLAPNEYKQFTFTISGLDLLTFKPSEVTAWIEVTGAVNQFKEYRDMVWRDSSPPYPVTKGS
jgi:hypothetical protein